MLLRNQPDTDAENKTMQNWLTSPYWCAVDSENDVSETAQDLHAVSDPGHLETSSPEVNVIVVFLETCMTPDMAFWLILISEENNVEWKWPFAQHTLNGLCNKIVHIYNQWHSTWVTLL